MLTEISIRVTGKMEKLMAMAYSSIPMDRCTRVSGKMISSTAMELSLGTTIKSNSWAISSKERKLDKVDLNSKAVITKETFLTVNSTASESTTFQTLENFTKVNSAIIIWKAKAKWSGQINRITKENSKMAKWKAVERKYLPVEIGMLVNGKTMCSTELACSTVSKTRPRDKVNGRMERGTAG